jgi:hypothetical protein
MVTLEQFKNGVARYIDMEILSKIGGWQKWVAGAFASMAVQKADVIFDSLKSHPFVSMMGIVSEDGMIDIEALHGAFRRQAEQCGAVDIELPMMGCIRLSHDDIDSVYRYIKQGG